MLRKQLFFGLKAGAPGSFGIPQVLVRRLRRRGEHSIQGLSIQKFGVDLIVVGKIQSFIFLGCHWWAQWPVRHLTPANPAITGSLLFGMLNAWRWKRSFLKWKWK